MVRNKFTHPSVLVSFLPKNLRKRIKGCKKEWSLVYCICPSILPSLHLSVRQVGLFLVRTKSSNTFLLDLDSYRRRRNQWSSPTPIRNHVVYYDYSHIQGLSLHQYPPFSYNYGRPYNSSIPSCVSY